MALGFGVVTGLVSCALGVGLVLEADTPFGRVWASVFVVFGAVSLLGALMSARPIDEHSRGARAAALATLLLLAGWMVVVGVVGAVEENWLWPVLMALPAAYLLRALWRLLRAGPAGRTAAGDLSNSRP